MESAQGRQAPTVIPVAYVGEGLLRDCLVGVAPDYGIRLHTVSNDIGEAIRAVEHLHLAACIVELPIKGEDTREAIGRLSLDGASEAPVIAIGRNGLDVGAEDVLQVGARGYITDRRSISELFEMVRKLAEGRIVKIAIDQWSGSPENSLDPHAKELVGRLTFKERDCIEYVVGADLPWKVIARCLGVTRHTLYNHIYRTYKKLEFPSGSGSVQKLRAFMETHGIYRVSDGGTWNWPEKDAGATDRTPAAHPIEVVADNRRRDL